MIIKTRALRANSALLTAGMLLAACGGSSQLPEGAAYGPDPVLPEPDPSLIPIVNVAEAEGWPQGRRPTTAASTQLTLFAEGLQNPRWLYELPGGDILVAESKAPEGSSPGGLKNWVRGLFMKRATSSGPSADRITLLRDVDGDGRADIRHVFLDGLTSPFGMALIDNHFYVANADALVRFEYQPGQSQISSPPEEVLDLTLGSLNHHWTKSLIASPDGESLYIGIGSNSNVGENGMDEEEGRAAIWQFDVASGDSRIFASGLRNPVGMAWQPDTGELWAAVNERDELGSDLVPDYMTSVQEGGFYGWPWRYYGEHVDDRVEASMPYRDHEVLRPDYALGNHTASLGLTWLGDSSLPEPFAQGMIVGQHGSWNREPPSGYKVIFVPFENGEPAGDPVDILTGFMEDGTAYGRPVGVLIDGGGGLLVADDVGGAIWRVSGS